MQTLYAPADGGGWMPVMVMSNSRAQELIRQGYRLQLPEETPAKDTPEKPLESPKESIDGEPLNINTASLNELISLEGVGVAIAKKIQAQQGSIYTIEDLIQISERPNWQKLESELTF